MLGFFNCVLLVALWLFYYIYINVITVPQVQAVDVKMKKTISLLGNIYTIALGMALIWCIMINYIHIQNLNTHNAFWDSVYLSNNTLSYFFLIVGVLLLILGSSMYILKQNISFTSEYLIFIFIIIMFSYLLISSTSLFLAIFLLELVALLIFGKFTVSRILVNVNKIIMERAGPLFLNQFSYGLFNSLFFQFWANFVSSLFLFFSLINVHYLYGLSNFFIVNFFYTIELMNWYAPQIFTILNIIVLTSGLFVKLGLSPYQFFKIETYKGIPLFMVIVYTTLYLVVYIYFFLFLFLQQTPILRNLIGLYLLISLAISIFYLISLLFDTKNFKAFLSYSTLITIINLLIIILIT